MYFYKAIKNGNVHPTIPKLNDDDKIKYLHFMITLTQLKILYALFID